MVLLYFFQDKVKLKTELKFAVMFYRYIKIIGLAMG